MDNVLVNQNGKNKRKQWTDPLRNLLKQNIQNMGLGHTFTIPAELSGATLCRHEIVYIFLHEGGGLSIIYIEIFKYTEIPKNDPEKHKPSRFLLNPCPQP